MSYFLRYLAFILLIMAGAAQAQNSSDRILGAIQPARGIKYNARWYPPDSPDAWAMDCSNTARWIARVALGMNIPRTASDQYLYFAKRGQLKRTKADSRRLIRTLKPGDFLFWRDTYRPRRKPPVTHVMVYLGRSAEGHMLMAGSQSSRGVDIYRFQPEKDHGGYRWLFFFKKPGRFVAYARP